MSDEGIPNQANSPESPRARYSSVTRSPGLGLPDRGPSKFGGQATSSIFRNSGSIRFDSLPFVSPSDWVDNPAPPREWIAEHWIPALRATLLTGEGGTGKSLLAQQLATCTAMGMPFLGVPIRQQNSLYLTCEDDMSELHRRQEGINKGLGITMSDLHDRMLLVSRVGELDNSLLDFDGHEGPALTEFYEQLRITAERNHSFFIVLDNIAHTFTGNENIRSHVAIYCNAMERLASSVRGAVLFLGHPSKAGAQFSGSTAWENQVRSRLYLSRPDPADIANNQNKRTLTRSKSNYAATGEELAMQWHEWAFLSPDDDRCKWHEDVEAVRRADNENEIFIACLEETNRQRRPVSHSPHAQNYAPKAFAKMPSAKGLKSDAFARSLERLMHLGDIEIAELWRGADRKPVMGLNIAGRLRDGCGTVVAKLPETHTNPCGKVGSDVLRDGSQEGCGTVGEKSSQTGENPCGTVAGLFDTADGQKGAGESPPPIGGEGTNPAPEVPEWAITDEDMLYD